MERQGKLEELICKSYLTWDGNSEFKNKNKNKRNSHSSIREGKTAQFTKNGQKIQTGI